MIPLENSNNSDELVSNGYFTASKPLTIINKENDYQ